MRQFAMLLTLLTLLFSACARTPEPPPSRMVEVQNGAGGTMWIDPVEGLPVSNFDSGDFISDVDLVKYTGAEYTVQTGLDVSEHQKGINWKAVKKSGVDFAIIRAGYRGYTEGGLYEDAYFRRNLKGALDNGLDVGVYFFSQAVTVQEALEEAEMVLSLIDGADIALPVFFDWEHIDAGDSRTADLNDIPVTDIAAAFCSAVEEGGCTAGVYFYRSLGYITYDLGELSDYVFWAAAPGEYPDFYYGHEYWQYSFTAYVPGIIGMADLNLRFVPAEPAGE